MVRVKICCMASADEVRLAVELGAAAVGLVSAMPSGPGVVADDALPAIADSVPPGVAAVLLTAATEPREIVRQQRAARVGAVQLVDRLTPNARRALRDALPGVRILQVVHVTGPASVEEAAGAAEASDAVLLDSGRPDAPVRELGGTGRVHDWALSARIREASAVPVFLAGGLRPDNVSAAVRTVRPYGVDVCSGVRTDGRLDRTKLAGFMAAVRRADPGRALRPCRPPPRRS